MGSLTRPTDTDTIRQLHQESTQWLSALDLWQLELNFFKKILNTHYDDLKQERERKDADHFLRLIYYYQNSLIKSFQSKVEKHEQFLANALSDGELDFMEQKTYTQNHSELSSHIMSFEAEFKMSKMRLLSFFQEIIYTK